MVNLEDFFCQALKRRVSDFLALGLKGPKAYLDLAADAALGDFDSCPHLSSETPRLLSL